MWAEEAEKRLQEYRIGKVQAVPDEEVFGRIQSRLHPPAEGSGPARNSPL
jgi:hypothetical protein